MEYTVQKKVQQARIKLFKKSEGLSFFGACSYMFDWNIHKMPGYNAEGFVLFDKTTNHVEDGTIHINEELVMKEDYTHVNLAYIISHELLHILGKHGVRKGGRIHEIWCVACDHIVERDLKLHANAIQPYDKVYHMFDELNDAEPNCTVERAYEWIQQQIRQGKIKIVWVSGGMIGVNGPSGQEFLVNPQVGGVDNKKIKGDALDTIQTNEKIVAEARALHQTLKAKGNHAGSLSALLDKILAVTIPWEVLLEKAIKTNVILKPDERAWKNPNKFFRPHGILLPGSSMAEDREGTGLLIYTTDSSGSMSDTELKKCSSVTEQSFQYFKEIYLYIHDTIVHQRKKFTQDEKHLFYHFLKNEGYEGRGGTSHSDVYKTIQKEIWDENGSKDDLSMVISLTDGFSDIESTINDKRLEWLKIVPVIFIISGSYRLDVGNRENMKVIYIDGEN